LKNKTFAVVLLFIAMFATGCGLPGMRGGPPGLPGLPGPPRLEPPDPAGMPAAIAGGYLGRDNYLQTVQNKKSVNAVAVEGEFHE
jgi:hypothetical protein